MRVLYSRVYFIQDLISKLLKVDGKDRLTANEALRHPWVRGIAASGEHMEEAQINIKKFNAKRKMKVKHYTNYFLHRRYIHLVSVQFQESYF